MAKSPFYPGYYPEKPNQSPSNPFYPGYYPGKALPRKLPPSGGITIGKIPEFGAGTIAAAHLDEIVDDIQGRVEPLINAPKWIKDRMAEDFKKSLKITSESPKGMPYNQLGEYDAEEVPGAGFISLSIDPTEWKKKGVAKMISGTLTDWAKGAVAFKDFETQTRQYFWKELIKSDPLRDSEREGYSDSFVQSAKEFADKNKKEFKGVSGALGTSGHATNPLALNGVGIYQGGAPQNAAQFLTSKDVYAEVGEKVVAFQRQLESGYKRDTAHDGFLLSSAQAVSTELNQKFPSSPTTNPHLLSSEKITESFSSRTELAGQLGKLGSAKADAIKDLQKPLPINIGKDALGNIQESLGKLEKETENARKALDAAKEHLNKKYGNDDFYNQCNEHIKGLETVVNSTNYQALKTAAASGNVAEAIALSQKSGGLIGSINNSSGRGNVIMGKNLTGGDIIEASTQRQLLRDLGSEIIDSRSGVHGLIVQNNLAAQRLFMYIPRMELDRKVEAIEELGEKVQKGFLGQYGWNNRLGKAPNGVYSILSPKDLVLSGLRKVQNFGLVLDEDALKGRDFYKKGLKPLNAKDDFSHVAPGIIFGNRFNVNVKFAGKSVKLKVWGGEHFKGHTAINDLLNKFDADRLAGTNFFKATDLENIFKSRKSILLKNSVTGDFIKDAVTGNFVLAPEFAHLTKGITDPTALKAMLDNLELLQKQIDSFMDYISRNVSDPNLLKNLSFWVGDLNSRGVRTGGLIKSLAHSSHIEHLTRRYLGLMEKASRVLNKAQNIVFTKIPIVSPLIQRFSAQAVLVQNAIKLWATKTANQMVLFFAKKLGLKVALNTVGQMIGSIAPIIGNLIALVLSYLAEKLIDLFTAALKRLMSFARNFLKGDISAMVAEMEKEQDKIVKRYLTIVLIIALLFILFESVVGLVVPNFINIGGIVTKDPFDDPIVFALSTFSPTDPTRRNAQMLQSFDWNIYLGGTINPQPIPGGPGNPNDPYNPGGPGVDPLPAPIPDTIGGCPVACGKMAYPSYNGAHVIGHGSDLYWNGYKPVCQFSIPILNTPHVWGTGTECIGNCSNNVDTGSDCYGDAASVPYYGYAADYVSTCGNLGVFAPDMDGVTQWSVMKSNHVEAGYWADIVNMDGPNDIYIHYMHLQTRPPEGTVYKTGDPIANMLVSSFTHVHAEIMINGTILKPEDVFTCK